MTLRSGAETIVHQCLNVSGDNTSYVPAGDPRRVACDIHWDTVCEDATVLFDDRQVLDEGDPVFLEH